MKRPPARPRTHTLAAKWTRRLGRGTCRQRNALRSDGVIDVTVHPGDNTPPSVRAGGSHTRPPPPSATDMPGVGTQAAAAAGPPSGRPNPRSRSCMRAPSVLAGFAPRVRTSSAAPRRSGDAASSVCASEAPTMSARKSTAGTRAAHTTRPPAPPPPTSTASAVRTVVSGDTTIPTGERGTVATAPTSPAELSTVPTPLAATSRSQPACTSMSSLPPLPVRNQRSSSSATGTISARVATLRAPPRRVAARTRDVARRSSRCPAASWTNASSSPISTTLA